MAKSTARPGSDAGLGGFGGFFDLKAAGFSDPVLVAANDGVGTKVKIAIDCDRHDSLGIDLVAMCVNDLIVQGAEPLFFLDYFATGKLNVTQGEAIVRGIAEGCRQAGCALIGGETAEMPGLYAGGDYDLAGFAVGAVERGEALTGADIADGDLVLGLASNGLHSNGFSLVRKVVEVAGLDYTASAPFAPDISLGEALLTPTKIYVRSCLAARKAGGLKGLAHITGGGLPENLPRVLPAGLSVTLQRGSWPLPPVFAWLSKLGGIEDMEMLRTFNCGVGMVAVVAPEAAAALIACFEAAGEKVFEIGRVLPNRADEPAVRFAPAREGEAWLSANSGQS